MLMWIPLELELILLDVLQQFQLCIRGACSFGLFGLEAPESPHHEIHNDHGGDPRDP